MNENSYPKKGMTLVEVMVAIMIFGIMAASGAAYLEHAARLRMAARGQQAATIEANSLLEMAFEAARLDHYDSGAGYYNSDTDMSYGSANPAVTWSFDGESFPVSIHLVPDA